MFTNFTDMSVYFPIIRKYEIGKSYILDLLDLLIILNLI